MEAVSSNYCTNVPQIKCIQCDKALLAERVSKCSRCKIAFYCDQTCQKRDWPEHKKVCKLPSSFSGILKEITLEGNKVVSYTATRAENAIRLSFFSNVFAQLVDETLIPSVQAMISRGQVQNPLGLFIINPLKFLPDLIAAYEEDSKKAKDVDVVKASGFTKVEILSLFSQSMAILEDFIKLKQGANPRLLVVSPSDVFHKSLFTFSKQSKPEDLEMWRLTAVREALEYVYERMQWKKTEDSFTSQVSCFEYVFEKIKLPKLDFKREQNYSWWLQLGLSNVKSPAKGDVVLYLNNELVAHVGIYKEAGILEHKPGLNARHVYQTSWADLTNLYGRNIVFLRKNAE